MKRKSYRVTRTTRKHRTKGHRKVPSTLENIAKTLNELGYENTSKPCIWFNLHKAEEVIAQAVCKMNGLPFNEQNRIHWESRDADIDDVDGAIEEVLMLAYKELLLEEETEEA